MERYSYEIDRHDDHLFRIFDKRRGHTESAAIARCGNRDIAEKIVAALNATCRK